jgi:hypothetical protein
MIEVAGMVIAAGGILLLLVVGGKEVRKLFQLPELHSSNFKYAVF